MADFTIYIGNKNYSSWSLRGWLMLKHTGADFAEEVILLDEANTRTSILRQSPSGRVPALRHGDFIVWESLAIGEYLAELFPKAQLWPERAGGAAAAELGNPCRLPRAAQPPADEYPLQLPQSRGDAGGAGRHQPGH